MRFKIQIGNPRGPENASCYMPLRLCGLLRVGAFAETKEVARLFYGLLFESLRSWVKITYLQISSSDSWWGRRQRDLELAPKVPVGRTPNALLFELSNADEMGTFLDRFWYRSPMRFYGTMRNEFTSTVVESIVDRELLDACGLVASGELSFIAERDTWGFFPNVLFAATDIEQVTSQLQSSARVLSSPLRCEQGAFKDFPMKLPKG